MFNACNISMKFSSQKLQIYRSRLYKGKKLFQGPSLVNKWEAVANKWETERTHSGKKISLWGILESPFALPCPVEKMCLFGKKNNNSVL